MTRGGDELRAGSRKSRLVGCAECNCSGKMSAVRWQGPLSRGEMSRSHGPLAMLLAGVLVWWEVHGVLVTLPPGNAQQISSRARASLKSWEPQNLARKPTQRAKENAPCTR